MADRLSSPAAVQRVGGGTSLADVLDRILDKGLVIDAWVRVSLLGLEILTVEARVVVASVDTYLRYADAIAQTQLSAQPQASQPLEATEVQPEKAFPSDEQIRSYLEENREGVDLDQLSRHFGVAKEKLESRLRRLESQGTLESEERASEPEKEHQP